MAANDTPSTPGHDERAPAEPAAGNAGEEARLLPPRDARPPRGVPTPLRPPRPLLLRERRFRRALFAVVSLVILTSFIIAWRLEHGMVAYRAPLIETALRVRIKVAATHLRLEEISHQDIDAPPRTIWRMLDLAESHARFIDRGVRDTQALVSLRDPAIEHDVSQLLLAFQTFRRACRDRVENPDQAHIGMPIHERFHSAYDNLMNQALRVEQSLQDATESDRETYEWVQILLGILCLSLFGFGALVFHRHDLREERVLRSLQHEIAERERAEDELTAQVERTEAIFRHSMDGFIRLGRQGEFLEVNPAFCRLLGYPREELLGLRLDDLEVDGGAEEIARRLSDARAGTADRYETRYRRKDGSTVEVEVSSQMLASADDWIHFSFIRDLTESKRVAEEKLRMAKKLRETQKLESLGVLAGGIAHDFNNILAVIQINADMLRAELAEDAPERVPVDRILSAGKRATSLARQMLVYSGLGRLQARPLDINESVRQISELLEVSVSKKVHLERDLAEGLPFVEGDPSQIDQVIMNLVTNASEAIGENEGTIRLTTRLFEADADYLSTTQAGLHPSPGTFVAIEVEDSGCGMSEETLTRVFEPFYSTKSTGRGLGMAALLGIVRAHQGAVDVESEPGRGTRFRVLLPISSHDVLTSPAPQRAPAPELPNTGTLLVVDDDDALRSTSVQLLRESGFQVVEASDGEEGVRVFRERRADIDLVLLDLVMPGLNGAEVLTVIRELDERVPVILSSGYSEVGDRQEVLDAHDGAFLPKPYRASELVELVRTLLGAARG